MKIADIVTEVKNHETRPQLFVRVVQEDGLSGIGECWWGIYPGAEAAKDLPAACQVLPLASTVQNILRPLLIGQDARHIEARYQQMIHYAYRYGIEGILGSALSGIDIALWDLAGKRLGVPVVELLGGKAKESVRAYASLPPIRDPERLRIEAGRAVAAGFPGIKLHEHDPDLAGLVRDEVGPDIAIMFDVNGHFDPQKAIAVARELMKHQICWFEEPTWPMRDIGAMVRLKEATGVSIAAGENEFSQESFYRLMRSKAVDFVMPEVSKIGGLTAAGKLTPLFDVFNLPFCPHSFRLGPAMYANVHWALSCEKSDWVEVPWLPEGAAFPSGVPIPPMENGRIVLPEGVGLGLPIE